MYNIEIEPIKLNEIIEVLKKDNNDINDVTSNVVKLIQTLDDSVWKSSEKSKVIDEFLPYLESSETEIKDKLEEFIVFLNNAIASYNQQNTTLKKKVDSISNVDIIEEL